MCAASLPSTYLHFLDRSVAYALKRAAGVSEDSEHMSAALAAEVDQLIGTVKLAKQTQCT